MALRLLLVLEGIAVGMLCAAMFMAGIVLPPIYSIERALSAMPGAALIGAPCGLICTFFLLRLKPVERTMKIMGWGALLAVPGCLALGCFGVVMFQSLWVLVLPPIAMWAFTAFVIACHGHGSDALATA